jgi:hypothetical protein
VRDRLPDFQPGPSRYFRAQNAQVGLEMKTSCILLLGLASGFFGPAARAADYPKPAEADFVIKDFKFASGETLPALRIHYRFLGHLERSPGGIAKNVVLILHRGDRVPISSARNLPANSLAPASRSTQPTPSSSSRTE